MGKSKIEAAPTAEESAAEKEKLLEETIGKKFDEIFDLKKYGKRLKDFGKKDRGKIETARIVLKNEIIEIYKNEKWSEEEITEKIIKYACDNARNLAEGEGIDGTNKDNFVSLIREIRDEVKTAAPIDPAELKLEIKPEPEQKITSEEKPETNYKPEKAEMASDLEANNGEYSFEKFLVKLEKNLQSRLEKVKEGKGEKENMKIDPKIYLDNFFGLDWDSLLEDEQNEITRICDEYDKKLAAEKKEIKSNFKKEKKRKYLENTKQYIDKIKSIKLKQIEKIEKTDIPLSKFLVDFGKFKMESLTESEKKEALEYCKKANDEIAGVYENKIKELKETKKTGKKGISHAKKAGKPKENAKDLSQKDIDFFESIAKTNEDKKTYAAGSTPEDALEKQKEIKNLKEIEKGRIIKIYEEYGRKFWEKLLNGADWEGYSKENKQKTLEIQTSVFLKNEMRKNGSFKGEDDKVAEQIIESITSGEKF